MTDKYGLLLEIIRGYGSAMVAFSGGVDSSLLAKAAYDALGKKAEAVIADSPSMARAELAEAVKIAEFIGIRYRIIKSEEMQKKQYIANSPDRCYHCKAELFAAMHASTGQTVCYGANMDDIGDYRPGEQAAKESNVKAPLKEAGMGKQDVRDAARLAGLPNWEKPAAACLASRIPYGMEISPERLMQVEKGEVLLKELGFKNVRLRHHGELARIELPEEELESLITHPERGRVVADIKKLGFKWVSVDMEGYRRGSLNEVL